MIAIRVGRVVALTVMAALALASLAYFAESQPAAAPQRVTADQSFAPRRSGTGVTMLDELFPSAAYVIETSEGLVLVDTGQESDGGKLLSLVEQKGLDIRNLKAILLTHCHGDHANGAQKLRALTGATVYAGQGDCEVLRAGGPWEAYFSAFSVDPGVSIHPTTVDVELLGGETIVLGDVRIEVLATPGHTPGSTCYLMQRGDGPRILFSGDTIMSYDLLGTYAALLSPRYRGDAEQYLATLRMLSEMAPPDILMPGHPLASRSNPPQSRFDPDRWSAMLGAGIALLTDLLKDYETDGRDFLDGRPRELLPGLVYLGEIAGRSLYSLTENGALTLFDAPGGDELVGVLETRLSGQGLDLANLRQVLLTSGDAASASGLASLVERTGCRVVAADASLASLRALVPEGTELTAAETLTGDAGQRVRALSLAGLGVSPVAYAFDLAGKLVLVSGRIPIDPNGDEEPSGWDDTTGQEIADFRQTLGVLSELSPEIWLPSVPVKEPNANLYGDAWRQLIESNLRMLQH